MVNAKTADAIDAMIRTEHMHRQLIDSKAKKIGIHRTQHRILMRLAREGSLPSQKELAEGLDITAAAVTLAIQKLEAQGYVERTLGRDNRFNELAITDKGRAAVKETKKLFSEADQNVFKGFSDEELSLYVEFLLKMQRNMKNSLLSNIQGEKEVHK